MNLFARILSHAFAVLIVLLLAGGFIYRGDLFPEFEIPEYLGLEKAASGAPAASTARPEPGLAGGGAETPPAMPAVGMPAVQPVPEAAVAEEPPQPVQAAGSGVVEETVVETAGEAVPEAAPPGASVEAGAPSSAEVKGISESPATARPPAVQAAAEPVEEAAGDQGEAVPAVTETGGPGGVMAPAPAQSVLSAGTEASGGTPSAPAGQQPEAVTAMIPAIEEARPGSQAMRVPEAAEATPAPGAPLVATVEDKETAAMRPYQLLAKAREAFWLRDYAAAEKYYLALTRREPDNPDGFGELANMYFSQGKWEEAAAAYYEAGVRLIDEGLLEHAGQMAEVIRGLNGTQAEELEQQIEAARNPAS